MSNNRMNEWLGLNKAMKCNHVWAEFQIVNSTPESPTPGMRCSLCDWTIIGKSAADLRTMIKVGYKFAPAEPVCAKTQTDPSSVAPPSPWQPMATAQLDRKIKIDILAKTWLPQRDEFILSRFPDCRWYAGHDNVQPHWEGVDQGWCPVGWMHVPTLVMPDDTTCIST